MITHAEQTKPFLDQLIILKANRDFQTTQYWLSNQTEQFWKIVHKHSNGIENTTYHLDLENGPT